MQFKNKSIMRTCFLLVGMLYSSLWALEPKTSQYNTTLIWFNFESDERFEVKGSKHYLADRLKMGMYNGIPIPLKYNRDLKSKKSLGINVSWSQKGFNWIDIVPAKDHPLYNKVFPGILKSIDLWIWGANYDYMLYITLENEHGFAYDLLVGSLAFTGWKKLHLKVPPTLIVRRTQLASEMGALKFRRFRVYTGRLARVDRFSLFIDYMRINTDLYGGYYDGVDLERVFFEKNDPKKDPKKEKTNNQASPSPSPPADNDN